MVTLASVSLFGGAVTASSVEATDGKGSVAGLQIDGTAVSAAPWQTLQVEGWGQVTLGAKIGRLSAPLVLRVLQAHDGIPAGTSIVIAFSAAAQPVAQPRGNHRSARSTHAKRTGTTKKHQSLQAPKPPPDYPASTFPFLLSGGLAPSARHDRVVSTAMHYLGVPYRWAGASPATGFDCSGLVTYVFARLGVSLPHYTVSQWHSPQAVYVAPNRLKPGDLVFFVGSDGTRKAPGHVGIYVGDGYFIDAPHTGTSVRIDSLSAPQYANQYVGARRIVGQLLAARHLLAIAKPKAPAPAASILLGFSSPVTAGPLSKSFGVAAAGTAVVRTASHSYRIWAGVAPGVLLILLLAGALVFRRRRPMERLKG